MDDFALLSALKERKCRKAFEQLFRKHYKPLSLYAFYIVKNEMDAEDLVQTLFAEIWEKEMYHQIHTNVKSYLQTAVYNRSLNLIAKQKTSRKHIDSYTYLHCAVAEETTKEKLKPLAIQEILENMPGRQSKAVELVYLKDKKYSEAAEEMGITLNSIKTHLKLAIKLLKKQVNIESIKS